MIDNDLIELLKTDFRGDLIVPDDPQYNESRKIWNDMIDKKPAIIARCLGVADIISCVNFARDNKIDLSVKGKGHNIAGNSLCNDGITIDLSNMNTVVIDPINNRANVSPGADLGDFDYEAQAFGLTTPLGINSTTGVAGLTLGGGFGWLTRQYGMTIDNLVSADVVTAEGKLVKADNNVNKDLFWAIRGGGGNFGIVTRFEYDLHPVGPEIFAGLIVHPFENAKNLLNQYNEYVDTIPNELTVWIVSRKAPPLPFLSEDVHGKEVIVFAFLYNGNSDDGQKLIEPIRNFGNAHGEHFGPMPYKNWQQAFDPLLTPGARNYWKSHNLLELSEGAIDSLIKYSGIFPSDQCEIFIALLGGKASEISVDSTAYSHRDAKFVINVHSRWNDPSDDDKCISWAREFFDDSAKFATGGAYVNFVTDDEEDSVKRSYGSNYDKLVQIKKKYDPDNLFKINHNISPNT